MDGVDQTFIILLTWYRLSDAKTQIINVIFVSIKVPAT